MRWRRRRLSLSLSLDFIVSCVSAAEAAPTTATAPTTAATGAETLTIRWSSWWSMNRKLSATPSEDYGARRLNGEGKEMDSADRSFLEYGLSSAVNVLNSTSLTNSSSCHNWTGDDALFFSSFTRKKQATLHGRSSCKVRVCPCASRRPSLNHFSRKWDQICNLTFFQNSNFGFLLPSRFVRTALFRQIIDITKKQHK